MRAEPTRASSFAAAKRALQTVETSDPTALRAHVLDILARLVGADVVALVGYDLHAGELRYTSPLTTRADLTTQLTGTLDGKRAMWNIAQHLRPTPAEHNRFVAHTQVPTFPPPPDHPLHRYVYRPLGTAGFMRALCFDGPRFVGYLMPSFADAERVTRDDVERLNRLVPEVVTVLTRADRIEREALDTATHFVVSADGHIAFTTRQGESWLTPSRRARIGELVRRADRTPLFETAHVIDGARATLLRLHGASVVYLVTLVARTAPELAPDHLLTPRQREVAEYAVAGATVREIAESLATSPETVRQHLKEVYRRLGVASRLELAQRLAR